MRNLRDGGASFFGKGLSLAAITLIGVSIGLGTAQARPLVPAEQRYESYSGALPSCADPGVFERISSRFGAREGEFWKSGLAITGFDEVREIGFRSHGLDYIPRRYCMARATFNDQSARTVSYAIGEDLGIIGWGYGVDWCVSGLDRNYAYAPHCQEARP